MASNSQNNSIKHQTALVGRVSIVITIMATMAHLVNLLIMNDQLHHEMVILVSGLAGKSLWEETVNDMVMGHSDDATKDHGKVYRSEVSGQTLRLLIDNGAIAGCWRCTPIQYFCANQTVLFIASADYSHDCLKFPSHTSPLFQSFAACTSSCCWCVFTITSMYVHTCTIK